MVQLVNYGVDTLYINVYHTNGTGERVKRDLDAALASQLEQWKKQAQAASDRYPTSWIFNDAHVMMCPNGVGAGQYPWMLKTDDLTLCISQGHWNGIASVRFNSDYLWSCPGLPGALKAVHRLLEDIFKDEMQLQPSQIDLCADIAGWDDIGELDRHQNFITRSRKRTTYAEPEWGYDAPVRDYSYGLHGTGFDFSKGGPIACRIYNKTREIKRSGKEWVPDLWRCRGWNEAAHPEVWRVEYPLKREFLRDIKQTNEQGEVFHGVEDAYQLSDLLELLWIYAAGRAGGAENSMHDGWLRCVIPTSDKNRARWPTHPVWSVVQSAFTDPLEVPQDFGNVIRKAKEDHNIARGIEAMIGYATSLSCWVGGELAAPGTDLSLFLHWFMKHGEKYLRRKDLEFADEVQRKRIKFGCSSSAPLAVDARWKGQSDE